MIVLKLQNQPNKAQSEFPEGPTPSASVLALPCHHCLGPLPPGPPSPPPPSLSPLSLSLLLLIELRSQSKPAMRAN